MSKEKQIEDMAKAIDESHWRIEQDWTGCHINSTTMVATLYNAGYRKQSGWVSVKERLPDIDDLCLLCMENRITKYRWVDIGYYHINYDEYVTHWMPLPSAPKGE